MTTTPKAVYELGQSLWYDNIERRLLENGELAAMIDRGDIYGVTSNPSIFKKAIGDSNDYDDDLQPLAAEGLTALEIFDRLAIEDIQAACDLFAGVYASTNGGDGYVSIEVNPDLAHDTDATCDEAQRLWETVDRPNLMVKIPATKAGIPAIQRSLANGLNINITLIFSQERYAEVMEAYVAGLEERVAKGEGIENIASVASFFVSRIDSKIDGWLQDLVRDEGPHAQTAANLQGKVAVANAVMAYQLFKNVFESERFAALKEKGARVQRPLWASTSTKNPDYPDTLYIDELIGADTVNTVPPNTLEAFKDHGTAKLTIEEDVEVSRQALADLEEVSLSLAKATQELEDEGVAAFSKAFKDLLETVEERRLQAVS
ncbi:MAG: transaldolase [Chloroflexi bacterium]|nr:MAG: transaldolase [Chloroflexota bacterium]MBL1195784.1 transaldolase [Chloroflexota bacterium]NOH13075.1 transaldolase [Chloroflexota bacterium]